MNVDCEIFTKTLRCILYSYKVWAIRLEPIPVKIKHTKVIIIKIKKMCTLRNHIFLTMLV